MRCVVVDQRCRESKGKVKIEGYMSISDEEAHHWTRQMATKTEDSLVFSWEGRHIPFLFCFLFWTFLFNVYFHFRDWVSEFCCRLSRLLYVHDLHSKFAAISCSHFDAFGQFPLIHKNTSMAQHFRFVRYLHKCHEAEVFGYDESLWAFPLSFDFMFCPDVPCLSAIILIFKFRPGWIVTYRCLFLVHLYNSSIHAD